MTDDAKPTLQPYAAPLPEPYAHVYPLNVAECSYPACFTPSTQPAPPHLPHQPIYTAAQVREVLADAHAHYESQVKPLGGLATPQEPAPIDMVLFCPACGAQHIDGPKLPVLPEDGGEVWYDPPHKTHLCTAPQCGHRWRPADVPTTGVCVWAVKTHGKDDSPLIQPVLCTIASVGRT